MNEKGCISYICFLALLLFIPIIVNYSYVFEYVDLSPWDYQKLTDVEARIELNDDAHGGDVMVTERVTFDVHQASKNDLCYELWRDLPEQEVDGLKLDYSVLSVSQIMDDGTKVEYRKCSDMKWNNNDAKDLSGTWYHSEGPYSKMADQYECVFFYVDGIYRDQVTFEITYKMNNVALRYKDCSDLYLLLYSESPIKDLESYKAEILIPNEDMPDTGNYEFYTYGTNENSFDVYESSIANPGYRTFIIDLDEDELQFKPYNLYLEFELVAYNEDKHIFTENANRNYYTYDYALDEIRYEQQNEESKPAVFSFLKTVVFVILITASIYIIYHTINTKKRMKAQHMFYEAAEVPEYYTGIPSDLDPNFAAALVFSKGKAPKDDSGIYSALLLSLSRKGYVEISEYGVNDAMLTIKNPALSQEDSIMPAEPLSESEVLYYNLLVRHSGGDQILMSAFQRRVSQDYEYTGTFEENIKTAINNIGVNGGYVQKTNFTELKDKLLRTANTYKWLAITFLVIINIFSFHTRMDFAFGSYFIFGFSCLFGFIYLKATAGNYVLLTQLGENEYAKWQGLYNYLKSDHIMSDSNVANMPVWERFFIYATAFGIPTKVTEALGVKIPAGTTTSMDYYNDYGSMFSNSYVRSGRFHTSSRGIGRAVHSGSKIHKATSTSRGYTGGGRSWSSYGGGGS